MMQQLPFHLLFLLSFSFFHLITILDLDDPILIPLHPMMQWMNSISSLSLSLSLSLPSFFFYFFLHLIIVPDLEGSDDPMSHPLHPMMQWINSLDWMVEVVDVGGGIVIVVVIVLSMAMTSARIPMSRNLQIPISNHPPSAVG